jgi:hypothetical protein
MDGNHWPSSLSTTCHPFGTTRLAFFDAVSEVDHRPARILLMRVGREAIDDSEQLRVCLESLFAVPTSDAKHGRAQAGPLHAAQSPGLHVHTAPRFVLLPVPLRMFNSRMLGTG